MARFDVDFAHVRRSADMAAVLSAYNVTLIGEGKQRKAHCPFHEDPKPSLSVNVEDRVFQCFSCGCKGNAIKLIQLLDQSLENPRLAALKVAELSGIAAKPSGVVRSIARSAGKQQQEPKQSENEVAGESDGNAVNRPLTFSLQLTPVSQFEADVSEVLAELGLVAGELDAIEAGIAGRGMMKDRLAVPIRNAIGELVAYCGVNIGLLESDDEPLVKYPDKFRRDLELFQWSEAQHYDQIVIVADVVSALRYTTACEQKDDRGWGIVALMGETISERQIELLQGSSPDVLVCLEDPVMAVEVAGKIASTGLWVSTGSLAAETSVMAAE